MVNFRTQEFSSNALVKGDGHLVHSARGGKRRKPLMFQALSGFEIWQIDANVGHEQRIPDRTQVGGFIASQACIICDFLMHIRAQDFCLSILLAGTS
jgi:hypothetical protein